MELYVLTYNTTDGYTYSSESLLGVFDSDVSAIQWCNDNCGPFEGEWEVQRGTEDWYRMRAKSTGDSFGTFSVEKKTLNTAEWNN